MIRRAFWKVLDTIFEGMPLLAPFLILLALGAVYQSHTKMIEDRTRQEVMWDTPRGKW